MLNHRIIYLRWSEASSSPNSSFRNWFGYNNEAGELEKMTSTGAPTSPLTALIDQSFYTVPSFNLECGAQLKSVPVAYKTWGSLNETKDNVMIICHAFTGSADVEDW
jgi:hypothetical protein